MKMIILYLHKAFICMCTKYRQNSLSFHCFIAVNFWDRNKTVSFILREEEFVFDYYYYYIIVLFILQPVPNNQKPRSFSKKFIFRSYLLHF